jgi:CRP-like cAMP-binding protein
MTDQRTLAAIATGDIFRDLEPEQRDQIEQLMTRHTYASGHLFHSPYEYGDHIFVLLTGRVRLYKLSAEGRALTLMVLEPVTFFGEMAMVGNRMHDSFAEAMSECLVGVIKRDTLQPIIKQYPQVSLSFMELMGQRLRETENKLADIAFKSVPQRLATVLLNLVGGPEQAANSNSPTVVRFTHQQLAEMIGSYRETVTKAIGEFREAGLIRVDEDAIHLTNLEQIRQLANK